MEPPKTIVDKVKKFLVQQNTLMKQLKIKSNPFINFPTKKKVPLLSRLAIKILQRQGGIIDMRFYEDK